MQLNIAAWGKKGSRGRTSVCLQAAEDKHGCPGIRRSGKLPSMSLTQLRLAARGQACNSTDLILRLLAAKLSKGKVRLVRLAVMSLLGDMVATKVSAT